MEYLKNWFLATFADAGMGFVFFLLLGLFCIIWFLIVSLEDKQWNLFIKIILCLFLLLGAQVITNAAILFGFRFDGMWFLFLKPILEGALIPVVFFKAIPRQGQRVAFFFVAVFVALQIFVIYSSAGVGGIIPTLMASSAILTYIGLSKGILIEHQNRRESNKG